MSRIGVKSGAPSDLVKQPRKNIVRFCFVRKGSCFTFGPVQFSLCWYLKLPQHFLILIMVEKNLFLTFLSSVIKIIWTLDKIKVCFYEEAWICNKKWGFPFESPLLKPLEEKERLSVFASLDIFFLYIKYIFSYFSFLKILDQFHLFIINLW